MTAKKISIGVSIAILAAAGSLFFFLDKTVNEKNITEQKTNIQNATAQPKVEKKYDLYNSTPYDLPFSSIVDISKLPENTKKEIDTIIQKLNYSMI